MSGYLTRSLLLATVLGAGGIASAIALTEVRRGPRTTRPDAIARPAGISAPCRYVASPYGRDRNSGSVRHPFRTVQRLADRLRPGDIGCLRAGTYIESPDVVRGGLHGRRVTIQSYPGERARLDGALWVTSRAPYVTVRDLTVCGAPAGGECAGPQFESGQASAVQVSGGHAIFEHDDVSNATGICFILGTAQRNQGRDGPGDHTTVADSTIHNCGVPGQSNVIEGIYVEYSAGSVIEHDLISHNAAMGIQLYPAAQYTAIEHNWLWDNGEGVLFSGSDDMSSNHNRVAYNVIGHSVARWNIESYWSGPVGSGNVAYDNCLYADNPLSAGYYNQQGGIEPAAVGADGFISIGERRWPACAVSLTAGPRRP